MFHKHLKKLRKNLNLSQHQLATKLNLASDEFLSIDANTVSRWERGLIKPTLSKQLRILRCFTTDLMPYLKSLNHPISGDKLNKLLYTRFQNVNIRLATASYKKTEIEKRVAIEETPLFDDHNDHTIDDIKYLHTELDNGYPGLFDINLYQYHRDKKVIGKKFIDKDTKALIGHSVSLIFDGNFIESSVKKNSVFIDVTQAVKYTPTQILSCLNAIRFSSSLDVFKTQFSSQLKNLATHANVHNYYICVENPEAFDFMNQLGFETIAYDKKTPKNGCKVGSNYYKRVLLGIESSLLLSNKELLTLLIE